MTRLIFIGYIVLFDISLIRAQCVRPSMENLTVQSNFNLAKFLGIWYEIKWLPGVVHRPEEIWRDCYQSFELDNTSISRLLVPGRARTLNQKECFAFGPWSIIANNSAKMILEKKDLTLSTSLNWPYYILKTDYVNYASIYGCTTPNATNPCEKPILWLFGRTRSLSTSYTNEMDGFIANNLCINLTELEITPHDGNSCYSSSTIPLINFILLIFVFLPYVVDLSFSIK